MSEVFQRVPKLPDSILPDGAKAAQRYGDFLESLPDDEELMLTDFRKLVFEWLKINRT
jgi:hypothetical protein